MLSLLHLRQNRIAIQSIQTLFRASIMTLARSWFGVFELFFGERTIMQGELRVSMAAVCGAELLKLIYSPRCRVLRWRSC
jgi:hypothetical protein